MDNSDFSQQLLDESWLNNSDDDDRIHRHELSDSDEHSDPDDLSDSEDHSDSDEDYHLEISLDEEEEEEEEEEVDDVRPAAKARTAKPRPNTQKPAEEWKPRVEKKVLERLRSSKPFPEDESDGSYEPDSNPESEPEYESDYDSDISEESNPPKEDAESGFSFVHSVLPGPLDEHGADGPPYRGPAAGIKEDVPVFDHPKDAFVYLMDNKVVQSICDWTEARYQQWRNDPEHPERATNTKLKVHSLKWKVPVLGDIYVFISLMLLMGVCKLPDYHMYWEHGPLIGGPAIFCRMVMSRNRFYQLLKFIRFAPPPHPSSKDPRNRIMPFLRLLKVNVQRAVDPGK